MFADERVEFLLINRQFLASKLGPGTGCPDYFISLSNNGTVQHLGYDRSQEQYLAE
jgi:hypothetical protein